MKCSVAAARGERGGDGTSCGDEPTDEITYVEEVHARGEVQFSSTVQPFVSCQAATLSNPLRATSGGGFSYRNTSGNIVTCTFDRDKCNDKRLTENSEKFLRKELGLSSAISTVAGLAASLG